MKNKIIAEQIFYCIILMLIGVMIIFERFVVAGILIINLGITILFFVLHVYGCHRREEK